MIQPVHDFTDRTDRSHALGLLSVLSAVMCLCTLALGWLLNAAYYNDNTALGLELHLALYQLLSSPSIAGVMGTFAWYYVACAALCSGLVYTRVIARGVPLGILLGTMLAQPFAFVLSATGARYLLENGWIDLSKMVREPVRMGASFQIDSFRFTQSSHGLGAVNVGDSGSIVDVLFRRGVSISSIVAVGVGWVVCLVMLFRPER